ncbi:MAG: hypothetical protein ACOX59_00300 [Bacteroidales bacterium]|jgi:hypothetical protein
MKKLYLFMGGLLLAASMNLSQAQNPMTEVKIGDLIYISHTGTGRVWSGINESSNIQIRDPKIAFTDTAQIWEIVPAQVAGTDSTLNDADFYYLQEKTGLQRFAASDGSWNSRVNSAVGVIADTTRYYWTFRRSATLENVFHVANGIKFTIDSATWTVKSVSTYMGTDGTGNGSSLYTDKASSNAGAPYYIYDAKTYAKFVVAKAISDAENLIQLLNNNNLSAYGDTLQTALDAVKLIDTTKTYDQYTQADQAKLDELKVVSAIQAIADIKTWQNAVIAFQNKITEAEGKVVLDPKYPASIADSLNMAITDAKAYGDTVTYQGSTVAEIQAEQAVLQGFINRMTDRLKTVDKLIAKIDEAKAVDQGAAPYPEQSKADFNAAIATAESYLAGITGTTALADIEQATATLNLQMYTLLISVATEENPIEVTDLISDPSFEESSGYTLSAKWKDASVVADGDRRVNSSIVVTDGNQCWNSWSNNFTSMNVYQDLTNLPNGVYRVTCDAITQEDYITDQHLYATTFETTQSTVLTATAFNTTPEAWETLSTQFVVFDGTARIGFASTSGGAQAGWFCIDNFRLYYLGVDPDAVETMFRVLLTQIQSDRMDYVVPLGEDPLLDAALEAANTFLEGEYTSEELDVMVAQTNAAWNRFKSSQTAALSLNDYIVEATEMYETADETVYPEEAFTELIDAINYTTELLGADATLKEDCEQALLDLQEAVRVFKYSAVGSEENPADFTFVIVNPELNTSSNATVPQGWTAAHENGNGYMGHVQHYRGEGYYYFDAWNGTAGVLKYKAYQRIADLPQGTYTLKMAGRGTNAGNEAGNDGVQIYAKAGSRVYSTTVPCEGDGNVSSPDAIPTNFETAIFHEDGVTWYGWNDITVSNIHLYSGEFLEIGVDVGYLSPFTGTWFSACDPRLYYLGPEMGTGSVKAPVKVFAYTLDRQIVVVNSDSPVKVYTITGQEVENRNLAQGIYLVRVDGHTLKVAVK